MKLRVTNVTRGLLVQIVDDKDQMVSGLTFNCLSQMKEQPTIEIELEDKK